MVNINTNQPALAGTSSVELEDFIGAKFYCLHALADGKGNIDNYMKVCVWWLNMFTTLLLHLADKFSVGQASKTGTFRIFEASFLKPYVSCRNSNFRCLSNESDFLNTNLSVYYLLKLSLTCIWMYYTCSSYSNEPVTQKEYIQNGHVVFI